MQVLRIAIADDHQILLEGLKSVLSDPRHAITVTCTARNGAELLESLAQHPVDVVLLDLNMPGGNGLDCLPKIRETYPNVKVIIFTMYAHPRFIKQAFKHGAEGYILKDTRLDSLVDGIRKVSEGNIYLSEGLTVFPGTNGEDDGFEDPFLMYHSLTRREMEILSLIARAKSNKEIGEELFISDQTVSVHRKNLMRKLHVTNSAGLIKFFIDKDLR